MTAQLRAIVLGGALSLFACAGTLRAETPQGSIVGWGSEVASVDLSDGFIQVGGSGNTASFNWTTVGEGDCDIAGGVYATVGSSDSNIATVGGACCTPSNETCVENVSPMDCTGPGEVFEPGRTCCEAECIAPGEEYASKGVELLSRVPLSSFPLGGGRANDVWGYTSPGCREYAVLGMYGSTAFVEITNPFHPEIIDEFADLAVQGDMKTYLHYAYVIKESPGVGLRIFDLTQIDLGTVTWAGTYTGAGLQSSHTMALNPDSGYVYLNRSNIGGLVAVNLSNPLLPTHGGIWNDSKCHDSQVVSYPSGVYAGREIAFCYAGFFGPLFIVDVTDKSNMFTLSSVDYPNRGHCHGGSLTGDRSHVLVNDEYDEIAFGFPARTIVINVEDLQNPFFVSDYDNGKCVVDHDHMVEGSLLYKGMYNRGLGIDDISDLGNAHEVAFFDTHPEGNARNFEGAWAPYVGYPSGVIVVSDRQRGLFVLNYDCNRNMIDDTEDIASGTSQDFNNNGLPDECEVTDCPPCGDGLLEGEECDDGNACTTNDTCSGGACVGGPLLDCDDGNACTDDVCIGGSCTHPPKMVGTACGNQTPQGLCDQADICDGNGMCVPNYVSVGTQCRTAAGDCDVPEFCTGSGVDCPPDGFARTGTPCPDDGDECTDDICNGAGGCLHSNNQLCGACCLANKDCIEDILPATCAAQGGTHQGAGSVCAGDSDGDGTDDLCDNCPGVDDDLFTFQECDPSGTRCATNADCPTGESCVKRCPDIPTVSEWGLVIMALLLMAGGKVYFGRRPLLA